MIQVGVILLSSLALQGQASPILTPRENDTPKKDDSFFLSFISTILITILAAAVLIVFYRYAVKYIPSKTIRIPLKVFSRVSPDGMIRLPTSEEESAALNSTFDDLNDPLDHNHSGDNEISNFHDDDDDIPPTVGTGKRVKMTENEEDFFDVSDDEEPEESQGRKASTGVGTGIRGDDATKAWRD